MPDLQNTNDPGSVSPRPPRTWDFMETALVCLIAYAVYLLASGLVLSIILTIHDGGRGLSPAQLQAFAMQGRWHGLALIVASPLAITVLWIAVRMAHREFAEYLALNWPSPRELMRALLIMIVVYVTEFVIAHVFGDGSAPSDPLLSVKGRGGLLFLLIGGCIAGPIMEEFIFRGFMFRGWSQSFLGPIGAVIATSAVFAMTHTQYDWFGKLIIFGIGLVLGHLRWRSNSTWLAVVSHSTLNIALFFSIGQYT